MFGIVYVRTIDVVSEGGAIVPDKWKNVHN
jgi:hypothetical protein